MTHVRALSMIGISLLLAAQAWSATEDPLPRRGYFGAVLDADSEQGVRVRSVLPDSPAATSGLRAEDVVTHWGTDRVAPENLMDFVRRIGATPAGTTVEAEVLREGQETTIPIHIASLPLESSADFETRYDSVEVDSHRQRVILTVPRGAGPHPALVYLQGVSCGSIESPLQPEDLDRHVASEWTRNGFAVLRIEKSGVGDSTGPPCSEIGFQDELRGYVAGLHWLTAQPGIDPQQIFLFGHSMGGVFAPLVAQQVPVRGIIVFGTIAAPVPQYFAENEERQMRMRGREGDELDRELARVDTFIAGIFGDRLTPAELEARSPDLHDFLQFRGADATHLYGRHARFWHELDDVGLPAPWARVEAPVLAIWGQADYPASRGDHVLLAETVNNAGRTTATFLEMENIGHGFDTAASMRSSMVTRMAGPFNRAIIDVTTEWMRQIGSVNSADCALPESPMDCANRRRKLSVPGVTARCVISRSAMSSTLFDAGAAG